MTSEVRGRTQLMGLRHVYSQMDESQKETSSARKMLPESNSCLPFTINQGYLLRNLRHRCRLT